MFSKNKSKFIKSLQIKKFRTEYKKFLVEGAKSILELINSDYFINELFVTEKFYQENRAAISQNKLTTEIISESDLSSISSFSNNNAAIAVATMKDNEVISATQNEFALILDDIKDPGNLGTIIRIADWYGISKIICSETTVDFYNPKVISASMGSFTRVSTYYCDLEKFLPTVYVPVYGADLDGKNVHDFSFSPGGYLLMGNESEGLSSQVKKHITEKIHIPRYGYAESLNVAVATAIICDNIKRKI
ncbi:MAG TPA: RNA methyltransferase [Cytophagaceae bacterium]|jgi:TrmH family RNA methyltransferase|nr:RNA methyltransferase [Cytophagaceae bacterium]